MKKESSSNKLEPKLRFPQFTVDWEQRKLGSISNIIDPHPSHRAPAEVSVGIPFIGIGDVDAMGNIDVNSARTVAEEIYDEHHRRYDLNVPSLGIGRVASLGKVIRLRNDIGKYAVSPTMSIVQILDKVNLDYLYSCMESPIFQKQFAAQSNGSTRQSVGIQDLRELIVSVPRNDEEQKMIGTFFKKLDNTITLHQEKLKLFKKYKRGLFHKIFTKLSTSELLINDVVDEYCKKTTKNDEYPILSSTMSGITLQNDYFGKQTASKNTTGYKIVPYGFMTYRSMSDTGLFHFNLQNIVERGIVSPAYPVFSIKNEYNKVFIEYILNETDYVKNQILFLKEGGTRFALSFSKFCNLKINVPSKKEQDFIANLIVYFDNYIEREKLKIDYLKIYKQGLLQQMFI